MCGSIFLTGYTTRVLIEMPQTQFSNRKMAASGSGSVTQNLAVSKQIRDRFASFFRQEFEDKIGIAFVTWNPLVLYDLEKMVQVFKVARSNSVNLVSKSEMETRLEELLQVQPHSVFG